ncbi:uncharacterized protein LOC131610617 [Vicia villosa]|uniref:uncharacterized protein LOC131610617 n=1 Tax=Vicia villosa TaxID=3911 RepID=UPI00273AE8D2|nr:uncharacterized protein LOC131610617 [Vicia villosa]
MKVWRVHRKKEKMQYPYGVLKWVLVWMCLCCYLVFTIGPPLHRRFKDSPCPQCDHCYCSSTEYPLECGKHDPAINEDTLTMLSEELKLQKIVANETLEHTRRLVMNARNTFSHYTKEAEKCNIGMETCEEAREKAEAELVEEHKLTALWENRARDYGWKDRKRTRLRS